MYFMPMLLQLHHTCVLHNPVVPVPIPKGFSSKGLMSAVHQPLWSHARKERQSRTELMAEAIDVLSPGCKQAVFQGMVQKHSPTHSPTDKPIAGARPEILIATWGQNYSRFHQEPSQGTKSISQAFCLQEPGQSHKQKEDVSHLLHCPWTWSAVSISPT